MCKAAYKVWECLNTVYMVHCSIKSKVRCESQGLMVTYYNAFFTNVDKFSCDLLNTKWCRNKEESMASLFAK